VRNGDVSFWYRDLPIQERRAPLPGDRTVDVAIVGGGFTGLWTAYYLKRADPTLEIAVIEREFAGFGASGATAAGCRRSSPARATATRRSAGAPPSSA